jgi:hypothetical protein
LLGGDFVEQVAAVEEWVSRVGSKDWEVVPAVLGVLFAVFFVGDDVPS